MLGVWRKVPESDAPSVGTCQYLLHKSEGLAETRDGETVLRSMVPKYSSRWLKGTGYRFRKKYRTFCLPACNAIPSSQIFIVKMQMFINFIVFLTVKRNDHLL